MPRAIATKTPAKTMMIIPTSAGSTEKYPACSEKVEAATLAVFQICDSPLVGSVTPVPEAASTARPAASGTFVSQS